MEIDLLRSWDFPFVLDSGSLLSLYREAQFFEHDDDIDLFLDYVYLNEMFVFFEENNVKYRLQYFKDRVVKVIVPASIKHRRIDVHVFTKNGSVYTSPAYRWKRELSLVRRLFRRIHFIIRPYQSSERLDVLARLGLIDLKIWTYPVHYFETQSVLYGLNSPGDIESYLSFRYGEGWRHPAPNWNYWHDDKALLNE
jgi:hypothetical protein